MEKKKVRVFLDGTSWEEEVGRDIDGTRVYPDVKAVLKRHPGVADECGVVECELKFIRWVKKPE